VKNKAVGTMGGTGGLTLTASKMSATKELQSKWGEFVLSDMSHPSIHNKHFPSLYRQRVIAQQSQCRAVYVFGGKESTP
jgi:hypothetical protein